MKIELTVPNSLSEITLGQYQEFIKVTENITNDVDVRSQMIKIFCGVDLKNINRFKAVDVISITDIISEMLQEKPTLIRRFKMYGKTFALKPNLDDLSFGAYTDVDNYISEWETMHLAMGALFRPITKETKELYNIEEYNPLKYDMKNMPLSVVLGTQVFFYNLGKDLSKIMITYSNQEDLTLQEREVLQKNGLGINQFTHSLMGMLQSMNISLN